MNKKVFKSGKNLLIAALIVILGGFMFSSCRKKASKSTRETHYPSFYFWRSVLKFYQNDRILADSLGVKHFYLRLLDLDYNAAIGAVEQKASLSANSPDDLLKFELTPVVYITNAVFLNLNPMDIGRLAENVAENVESHLDNFAYHFMNTQNIQIENDSSYNLAKKQWKSRIKEIQIDCDWTQKTKDNYFAFLLRLKKLLADKRISVTIRLWQYKYRSKAGIPPVDRGMLMCYNVADPRNNQTENAIADFNSISQYIEEGGYPLELDVALPLFSWGSIFRADKFVGLVGNSDPVTLSNKYPNSFEGKPNSNKLRLKEDMVLGRFYLREGDEVRFQRASKEDIDQTITLLKKHIDMKQSQIAFFDWNEYQINYYGEKQIKQWLKKAVE